MSIFSTNQAFPEQEQINLLVDQLNRLFSDYEQTENGIIYVGNDASMPDGFSMQVMDDEDESDASFVSYNDNNTVLGVDNVQDAIEVIAGGSALKMYRNYVPYLKSVFTANSRWEDSDAVIAKQGRLAIIDISAGTNYNPTTHTLIGQIDDEYLWPIEQTPVFSYRVNNTYTTGPVALIGTDGSVNIKGATTGQFAFDLYGFYITAK